MSFSEEKKHTSFAFYKIVCVVLVIMYCNRIRVNPLSVMFMFPDFYGIGSMELNFKIF